MFLTKASLKNPIAIFFFSAAMILLGTVSLKKLPIDLFPNINVPVIMVGTLYPGANPSDVERAVSYIIERSVSGVSNLDHVESTNKLGLSIVRVWFKWGTDINAAELEVSQMVQSVMKNLPQGIFPPFIVKFDISNIPICSITLEGKGYDEKFLYDLAFNTIEPQLESLQGVSAASVKGGKIREIDVELNPNLMRERGISVLDVERAVSNANLIFQSGDIRIGKIDYNIMTNSQVPSIKQLSDVVIKVANNNPIRIKDVGRVVDGHQIQLNVSRINGKRGVYLDVYRQPGTNTLEVVNNLKNAIHDLNGVPPGVKVGVTFDTSIYIRKAIESLKNEAFQGAILTFIVILLFLGSMKETLFAAVSIPLSVFVAFIFLYFTGQTLNTFTLGGLTLAIGRLIDDAIVVLECIHKHLQRGETPLQAALSGTQEVGLPVLSATITFMIVFLPVVFITGVARYTFTPLALTASAAMGASYLVSMTVIPALSQRFLHAEGLVDIQTGQAYTIEHGMSTKSTLIHKQKRPNVLKRILNATQRFLNYIEDQYEKGIGWALRHKISLLVGVVTLFVLSLGLLKFIGTEFFPEADEAQFRIIVRNRIGTRLEETEKVIEKVEKIIRETIPKEQIVTLLSNMGAARAGRAAFYSTNTGPHSGYVQVYLVQPDHRDKSTLQYVDILRPKIQQALPGILVSFDTGGVVKKILNFGYNAPIDVELSGYSFADAAKTAKEISVSMKKVPGLSDIMISREENYPEIDVNVDRQKAALLGISERDVAHAVLSSFFGNISGAPIFTDPATGNEYYVVTRLQKPFRSNLEDLQNNVFFINQDQPVFLKTIANIQRNSGPVQIDRRRLQRVIDLTANPSGRDLGSIGKDLKNQLQDIKLPNGFHLAYRGQMEEQEQTFKSLFFAMGLAIILIYMILGSQFRSFIHPLIVLFTVPMGLIGVFLILFLTKTTLSTTSLMGVIMLVGIAVSNGVLLIDYANVLQRQGFAPSEAITRAGKVRLRPILMTSLATIFGLIPLALGLEVGSEANAPLARTVVGGLGVSTLLTLFLIPVLYSLVEERFRKRTASFGTQRAEVINHGTILEK
ncbi:MAG: efflux RND transporter permease subunit [Planctomycetota bacterium]|nr:efflux RND transporter permease subunit [Planctomycetota bacterium]